ncbi:MAG: haloacid dehalogenase-like hydrolase [Gemmatimonadaceae bacterium]|nr:haloacid dehalogenase-like hydrolase [Gemmatimonadaceae bacterium]
MTAFQSVVLDVDSTVSAIEGIDWLAGLRDASVSRLIVALTSDAMDGRITLGEVYGRRLAIIRPTRDELAALGREYIATVLPGAREAIAAWQAEGVRVDLVSGGLRDALLPLADWLGVPRDRVHAVDVTYDDDGVAAHVREPAVLARAGGKPLVVQSLRLPRPVLAAGDGATDAELAGIVDHFIAFTGVARRANVVALAAGEADSFTALSTIVHAH